MTELSQLPSFRRPPLGEVVLVLQFEQLAKLDLRHIGDLASRFGDKYAKFDTHAPLDPTVERFDGPRAGRAMKIEMVDVPLFPRIWLTDISGEELVQIQRDRLMHNWRHTPIGAEYPRYPRLRDQFATDWAVLSEFIAERQLGELLPTQCEVAYVNQIEIGSGELAHDDPSRYFSFFNPVVASYGQAEFEAVTFSMSGVAKENTARGVQVGRLFVEVTSGVNIARRKPTYQFSLTLRGAPLARDLDGVLAFFDFARQRIVRAFTELTTSGMHKVWERQE